MHRDFFELSLPKQSCRGMSNMIFVISVSSLPDPLSSRFVGFKYFMQEEFFLLPERRICPCLCSSLLHSFGSSSACEGVLAGIIRDLHGMAALPTSFVHFPPILQVPLTFRACSNCGISVQSSSFFGCDFCHLFGQTSGRKYSGVDGAGG